MNSSSEWSPPPLLEWVITPLDGDTAGRRRQWNEWTRKTFFCRIGTGRRHARPINRHRLFLGSAFTRGLSINGKVDGERGSRGRIFWRLWCSKTGRKSKLYNNNTTCRAQTLAGGGDPKSSGRGRGTAPIPRGTRSRLLVGNARFFKHIFDLMFDRQNEWVGISLIIVARRLCESRHERQSQLHFYSRINNPVQYSKAHSTNEFALFR